MGNCWCFQNKPKKKIVLLLLGLDNAGKTVTVRGLTGESRHLVIPTVGFSIYKLEYRKCNINIYDLGGGPQIRGIWHMYYADAHGVIFVVDASDYRKLNEAREVLEEVLCNENISGKPVLLLANKQDVAGALDELDIVEKLKVEDLVNQKRCPTLVKSCSAMEETGGAKLDESIYKGYTWLLNLILRDYWKLNGRVERDLKEQRERNVAMRRAAVGRVNERCGSGTNSIEWKNGSGDQIIHTNLDNSENNTNKANKIQNNGENSMTSSWESQPLTPRIYFENAQVTNVKDVSKFVRIEHEDIPEHSAGDTNHWDVKKAQTTDSIKPRNIFRRTNRTAPATLLGISAIKVPISNKFPTNNRRLKSADTSSRKGRDVHRRLKSAGSNSSLRLLSIDNLLTIDNNLILKDTEIITISRESSDLENGESTLNRNFAHSESQIKTNHWVGPIFDDKSISDHIDVNQ